MCIGFPGKIISIDQNNYAIIDISGTRREVCLDIIDEEASIGDYVITHAGYAIHKIDSVTAQDKLKCLQEIIDHEIY